MSKTVLRRPGVVSVVFLALAGCAATPNQAHFVGGPPAVDGRPGITLPAPEDLGNGHWRASCAIPGGWVMQDLPYKPVTPGPCPNQAVGLVPPPAYSYGPYVPPAPPYYGVQPYYAPGGAFLGYGPGGYGGYGVSCGHWQLRLGHAFAIGGHGCN